MNFRNNRRHQKRIITILILSIFTLFAATSFSSEQDNINALRQMGKAFSSVASEASPAVVGIKTERVITRSQLNNELFNYFNNPRRSPRRQQPQPQQPQREQPQGEQELPVSETQGSGFIISPDGYILTNNHMVENTTRINIELTNGQHFVAKVIGSDPDMDVAVIKIDGNDLPCLEFADSDNLEVGEWVLAIGNPLGLAHTVTAGIVSAKGRTGFELNQLENYIQTDAAINFGNSGGPLINLDGKVVGINTAIAGSSGNIGIGFAIPINMAKYSYNEIIASGTVERGLLGIGGLDTITPDNAKTYGLSKDAKGVFFSQIYRNSAADKAGLIHRDVILEIDGKAVESALDLQTRISMLRPGTKVDLTIWRNEKQEKLSAELGKRSAIAQLQAEEQEENMVTLLGFKVQDINEATAKTYGYDGNEGVVVTEIDPDSTAKKNGLAVGTLIKEVNRKAIKNTEDFAQAIEDARQNDMGNVLLVGNLKGTDYNFFLKIP